jgi:hypothetical protein
MRWNVAGRGRNLGYQIMLPRVKHNLSRFEHGVLPPQSPSPGTPAVICLTHVKDVKAKRDRRDDDYQGCFHRYFPCFALRTFFGKVLIMAAETQDRGKKFNLFSHEISLAPGAIALKRASKGSDPVSNHQGRTLRNGSSAGPSRNNWRMHDACPIGLGLAEQSGVWS